MSTLASTAKLALQVLLLSQLLAAVTVTATPAPAPAPGLFSSLRKGKTGSGDGDEEVVDYKDGGWSIVGRSGKDTSAVRTWYEHFTSLRCNQVPTAKIEYTTISGFTKSTENIEYITISGFTKSNDCEVLAYESSEACETDRQAYIKILTKESKKTMNKFTKLFKGGNKNPSFDDSAEKIWDKSDNSGFEQSKLKYLEWKSDWDSYWVKCPKLLRVS